MQSTTSPSTIARRMSPSPLWLDDIDPFASTTPAVPLAAPVGGIERRIGKDIVEAQVFQLVLVKTALVVPPDIRVNATYRQIHLRQPPSGIVAFLAIDGDVADPAAML